MKKNEQNHIELLIGYSQDIAHFLHNFYANPKDGIHSNKILFFEQAKDSLFSNIQPGKSPSRNLKLKKVQLFILSQFFSFKTLKLIHAMAGT